MTQPTTPQTMTELPTQTTATTPMVAETIGSNGDDSSGSSTAQAVRDAGSRTAAATKEQASQVAYEATRQARDLLREGRMQAHAQARQQQQRLAGTVRSLSEELRAMADAPDRSGPAADLAHRAAARGSSLATWLDDREPAAVLDEVRSFASRRPGTFLAIAAGAGVLAGRLARGLQSEPSGPTDETVMAGAESMQTSSDGDPR
ncbi:MAG: hypothetical protein ACRC35_06365 [Angustibacter sp.]